MKALTIWRPWTWAICHPSPKAKRVENRTWAAPWIKGQRIAIHAGATYDDLEAMSFIADILGEMPPPARRCPTGIVAVVTVTGFRRWEDYVRPEDDPWCVGPMGWLLDDVRVLPVPVPCKGAQGLWTVPADVEARVLAQLAEPRRG